MLYGAVIFDKLELSHRGDYNEVEMSNTWTLVINVECTRSSLITEKSRQGDSWGKTMHRIADDVTIREVYFSEDVTYV